jgi:glycosyltransferase involved in cell wall biosynthesis
MRTNALRILLEMRPALDGHAGIPQETRLLFSQLLQMEATSVEGLLQSSNQTLTAGLPASSSASARMTPDEKFDRMSRIIVSLQQDESLGRIRRLIANGILTFWSFLLSLKTLAGFRVELRRFEAAHFEDFVWRSLFARSLPQAEFDRVTKVDYRVIELPWAALHVIGLALRRVGRAIYPRFDTKDFDVFISETPFPGRVRRPTQMIVRYHDSFPVLMAHTIHNGALHRASHYNAMRRNVRDGAWFACVSEATRKDLITLFPEVENRAVTIHNIVSDQFYPVKASQDRVAEIIHVRRNLKLDAKRQFHAVNPDSHFGRRRFILMVSTIEPRKNHELLLAVWENLRFEGCEEIDLVFVGSLGWKYSSTLDRLRPWVARGRIHMLSDVPSEELRVLYSHASLTVCPSVAEGFDFSGVEAMRCDCVVAASDIPVHREIFGDAAAYFNPYSVTDAIEAIGTLLKPEAEQRRSQLIASGRAVVQAYLPEKVMPRWAELLERFRVPRQG